jgi:hypothetical protein
MSASLYRVKRVRGRELSHLLALRLTRKRPHFPRLGVAWCMRNAPFRQSEESGAWKMREPGTTTPRGPPDWKPVYWSHGSGVRYKVEEETKAVPTRSSGPGFEHFLSSKISAKKARFLPAFLERIYSVFSIVWHRYWQERKQARLPIYFFCKTF